MEKRIMTGAGLPPIALEAVLKLLAIAQAGQARKAANPVTPPKLQLELAVPAAMPFPAAMRAAASAARAPQKRKPGARPRPEPAHRDSAGARDTRQNPEGATPC